MQLPEFRPLLSSEEVRGLEQHLLDNPDDLDVRSRLLTHYMMAVTRGMLTGTPIRRLTGTSIRRSRQRHIFWVIQNRPDAELAGTPFALVRQDTDGKKAVTEARRLWTRQVAAHPQNASVLGNAAKFLLYAVPDDRPQAEEWLRRAEALAPDNPEWPENLGRLCDFQRRRLVGEERKAKAHRALQHYERAFQLTNDAEKKVLLLDGLSKNAFNAEEWTKAGDFATRLLEGAPLHKAGVQIWNYGNALHWGHIMLGRLALRQGNLQEAKEHLQEAGNMPGSPQLNSFGPDTSLAKELLEHGEKEAVTDYLKACSHFWKLGKDQLVAWVSAIRQNRTPDFESRNRSEQA